MSWIRVSGIDGPGVILRKWWQEIGIVGIKKRGCGLFILGICGAWNGQNENDLSNTWIHDNISYVTQEPVLVSGTIRENLMYGCIDCTKSEMMEAANSFIRSFPEGLRHVCWRAWSIPFGWTEATHCDCPSAPASSACPGSWRGYEYLGQWEILDGVEGEERESSVNDGISFEQDCGYHLHGSRWCDSGSGKTWGVVEELRLLRESDSWMDWVWQDLFVWVSIVGSDLGVSHCQAGDESVCDF